jgi:uncharacterized membrane protein YedE/YeeE
VTHWSWWLSGVMLAMIPLAHWLVLRRSMAISGRYSALVDRVLEGKREASNIDLSTLIEAMRAETSAAFGGDAVAAVDPDAASKLVRPSQPQTTSMHVLFFVGLALGGLISTLLAGDVSLSLTLRGAKLDGIATQLGVPAPALLVAGGMLVGFGTRMAGGCTSGHGLCGVSQAQPGSLLATMAFFGAGVGASFALGTLL